MNEAREVDDERHVIADEPVPREHFDVEAVERRDGGPVRAQERPPGRALATLWWAGVEAMLRDHSSDRRASDTQVELRSAPSMPV